MSEQFVRDEGGTLSRDKVRIRERWAGGLYELLRVKSLALDPTIIELFPERPLALWLGDERTVDDMTGVTRSMPKWKATGRDSVPAKMM